MTNRRFLLATTWFLCLIANGIQAQHRQLQQGDRYYDEGLFGKAEETYRAGSTGTAFYNAGIAAYQQGKYVDAISLFKEAVAKSTSFSARADALYNLGNALLRQNNYKEAVTAYESSLRLSANRSDAKKNLKIAKRKMQEPPPEPPPPLPPPPPPPSNIPPKKYYLDQPQEARKKDVPPAEMPRDAALRLLESAILPEEQKNARAYRELSPATRPSRVKKDW